MESSNLLNVFRDLFEDILDVEPQTINVETTPDDVAAWDSLGNIRLLVALEAKLGVSFSTSEITGVESVGKLIDIVEEKLGDPT